MRRFGPFAAIALIVVLAVPPVVQADRKPTSKERAEIAAVVDLPAKCARVRVSTETEKPKWGSVTFKPGPSECDAHASNGVTVVKKSKGSWRFVTAGSSFDCGPLYKKVPAGIAADLGISCT